MKGRWWLLAAYAAFRWRWWRRCHYHTYFGRTLTFPDMVETHLALLAALDDLLRNGGIAWWMDMGTLLGAWRDGRYIPWDDDADACILHRDHARVLALGALLPPPLRMIEVSRAWSVDKVVPGLARVWPCRTFLRLLDPRTALYVDLFEAGERPDGRLEHLPLSLMHPTRTCAGEPFVYDRATVFPLQRLPFEGLDLPAPRDPETYLRTYFGADLSPDHVLDARGRWVPRTPSRKWRL